MNPHSGGYVKRQVLALLQDHGPMTRFEIGEELGIEKKTMGQCMSALHKDLARMGKRVHIVGWTRSVEGTRDYLRAVYAYGPGRDAKKPPRLTGREANKRYRERCHARYTSSSVFRAGVSQRRATLEMSP